jgi:hypothetical protein
MAKPWAWCLGATALVGLSALVVGAPGAKTHLVEQPAAVVSDPACLAGPDFSAAACRAAEADPGAALATAGADDSALASSTEQAGGAGRPVPAADAAAALRPADAPPPRPANAPATAGDGAELMKTSFALAGAASTVLAERLSGAERHASATLSRFAPGDASAALHRSIDRLADRLGRAGDLRDRARVYLFAGRGDQVVGYNLTRQHQGLGFATSGWSVEPAARPDEAQFGVAWRRGEIGWAVVEIRREMCNLGAVVRDNMLALRFSITGGDRRRPSSES